MTPEKTVSAESLFKEFRSVPLSEFFRKNRQYLGYVGKIKSLTTVIHELVSNSLDACEEAGILPDLKVEVVQLGDEHYKVLVEDNGPGIPEKHLEHVFGSLLTGTKFHRNIQLRGQQGLGVSGAVLFSQITTGQPTRVKSGTGKGKVVNAKVEMDIKTNSPKILEKEVYDDNWRGTIVEAQFKSVNYTKGQKGPFEYLRWTAASNPHAQIFFKDPEGSKVLFERVINKIPTRPVEVKPHPEGLEAHDILDLAQKSSSRQISSFLTTDLSRISSQKILEIKQVIDEERTKAGKPEFDMRKSPKRMEWNEADELRKAFKKVKFMAPPSSGLIPIGGETIKKALQNLVNPELLESLTRAPTTYKGGIPFLIEAAIAYGGNAGRESPEGKKLEIMRFANRAPLLFDAGSCALSKSMSSIDWKRYKFVDIENSSVTIFINIVSTHVPYTSAGKQAVAEEDEIVAEVRFALMQIGRILQKYLSGKRKAAERDAKKKMFERYVPETAKAVSKLSGDKPEDLEAKLHKIVLERFGEEFEGGDDEEDIGEENEEESEEEGGEE
ncbi:MAG: DNA topoisomerase VI subunit B [archaeon]